MQLVNEHRERMDVVSACQVMGLARGSYYRQVSEPKLDPEARTNRRSPRALTEVERAQVMDLLTSERFYDDSPREVYATLLDEGRYLCSVPTMYRILRSADCVRERRDQLQHPPYAKPELLATGPNQVWSWDITKLLGPVKWTYFYLYVVLDIFSRYVVGWTLAHRESGAIARELIASSCAKQQIASGTLVIHSDRGTAMKSKLVAQLMADLGVTKSESRHYVSDDNPFSESQFRTLKYRPDFPERFGCYEDAVGFCRMFFDWYNTRHRHAGIGFHTPAAVHYGRAEQLNEVRRQALLKAYARNPERFVKKPPAPPMLPEKVWINPPKPPPSEAADG